MSVSYKSCLKLQLCHVAIWGSIASWFIFLLIYCIPDIALYIAPHMIGQVWMFLCFVCFFFVFASFSFGNQSRELTYEKRVSFLKVSWCCVGGGGGVTKDNLVCSVELIT